MTKPKITGVYHPLTHGGLGLTNRTTWTVVHGCGSYLTDDWGDAVRYAMDWAAYKHGPRRIHLTPEPPRDRVIEARDADGEVRDRYTFSDGTWGGYFGGWNAVVHIAMCSGWSLWSVPRENTDIPGGHLVGDNQAGNAVGDPNLGDAQ